MPAIDMISDRHKGIQDLVLLCQCILVTAVFWLWFALCYSLPVDRGSIGRYVLYNEFVLLGLVVGGRRARLNAGLHKLSLEETSRQSLQQLGGTLFYLLLYLVAAQDARISRLFFFSFIPVLYLLLFFTNHSLPVLLGQIIFGSRTTQKIILLGPKQKARELQRWLERNRHLGLEILGLLAPDARTERAAGSSVLRTAVRHAPIATIAGSESGVWGNPETYGRPLAVPVASPVAASSGNPTTTTSTELEAEDSSGENGAIGSLPMLGRLAELEQFLAAPGVVELVIVEFPRGEATLRQYAQLCEAHGVRLLVVADLDQMFGHSVAVFEDQGMFFIGLREEPLEDPANRILKRCLDIGVSLPVVILILPPLMLAVWIFQRLQSPGPLFFWQSREGFHNELFNILKFRTMHVGTTPGDKLPRSREDPRLYPAGSFLRKTSLDEMPQFWNVLCGKMSVVGPRPHLKVYNDQYRKVFYRAYVRTYVKPGVTGLAQARGFRGDARTPEQVVQRMEADVQYLENWSFWLDCWLIFRTALQVIRPPKTAV